MARMSMGASFISKQAHMINYSDEVFQRWLEIVQRLENDNKKWGATSFRYLCGLEEDEVVGIQEEIEMEKFYYLKVQRRQIQWTWQIASSISNKIE